jgi:hypothetical protein
MVREQIAMTDLEESWTRTRTWLAMARELAVSAGDLVSAEELQTFDELLDENELQLAADTLRDRGLEHDDLSRPFWDALQRGYENMALNADATRCRFRALEAERGFVEARLTLNAGRKTGIFTDYRPDWNLGHGSAAGTLELTGARVTLEDCQTLNPGETGVVRLHPIRPEAWGHTRPGDRIDMHEGARIVGTATVLRVALKGT